MTAPRRPNSTHSSLKPILMQKCFIVTAINI